MLPNNLYIALLAQWQTAILPLTILAWTIAAILSFAVGANDCCNSFGTAVGSKSLTVRQACNLAAFFESFGAVFMSAAVGDTIRRGVFHTDIFRSFEADTSKNYRSKCGRNKGHGNARCLDLKPLPTIESKKKGQAIKNRYPEKTDRDDQYLESWASLADFKDFFRVRAYELPEHELENTLTIEEKYDHYFCSLTNYLDEQYLWGD